MEVEGARPMLRIAVPLVCWNVRAPRNCLAEFLIDPDSPSSSFSMAKERESERGRERESARERERGLYWRVQKTVQVHQDVHATT